MKAAAEFAFALALAAGVHLVAFARLPGGAEGAGDGGGALATMAPAPDGVAALVEDWVRPPETDLPAVAIAAPPDPGTPPAFPTAPAPVAPEGPSRPDMPAPKVDAQPTAAGPPSPQVARAVRDLGPSPRAEAAPAGPVALRPDAAAPAAPSPVQGVPAPPALAAEIAASGGPVPLPAAAAGALRPDVSPTLPPDETASAPPVDDPMILRDAAPDVQQALRRIPSDESTEATLIEPAIPVARQARPAPATPAPPQQAPRGPEPLPRLKAEEEQAPSPIADAPSSTSPSTSPMPPPRPEALAVRRAPDASTAPSAPQPAARAAGQGAAGQRGSGGRAEAATLSDAGRKALVAAWGGQIRARIERARPRTRGRGVVAVVLTVARDGQLLRAGIASSSGNPALDRAALSMVRGAGRFGAAPAGLNAADYAFRLPIRFE